MIPYGRQTIEDDDVAAVLEVLRSDWLTTGPKVGEFESAFAEKVGAAHAVAVSSGTAALHCAMYALGIKPGDEVIVPAMTFAASANCVVYLGATPVFSDVDPHTLLIDPADAAARITDRTRAIVAVDYAGQPCDYDELRALCDRHGLSLVADACHSLGARYKDRPVGSIADLSAFSFHPVKHITTGEGGMITTDNGDLAGRMRIFRNHGITSDHREREQKGSWYYEMVDLGYNYRITDLQCALGISQLKKLEKWVERRRRIAGTYDAHFSRMSWLQPLRVTHHARHSYHLYAVLVNTDLTGVDRSAIFGQLRSKGIGVNVHYIPVHLHPFYRERFGTGPGLCPNAERAYQRILSLPMFHAMTDDQVRIVINTVDETGPAEPGQA